MITSESKAKEVNKYYYKLESLTMNLSKVIMS